MAGEVSERIREAIADVGTDVRTFVVKTTDSVADATEDALRGSTNVAATLEEVAADVTSAAIKAVDQVGVDHTTVVVNSIQGTIRGARRLGHSGRDVVEYTSKGTIKGAVEAKGDLGQVTRSAMVGAIIGTRDMALSAEDATAEVSQGVLVALHKAKKVDIHQSSRDTIRGAVGGVARSNPQLAGVISSVTQANINTAMMIGKCSGYRSLGCCPQYRWKYCQGYPARCNGNHIWCEGDG